MSMVYEYGYMIRASTTSIVNAFSRTVQSGLLGLEQNQHVFCNKCNLPRSQCPKCRINTGLPAKDETQETTVRKLNCLFRNINNYLQLFLFLKSKFKPTRLNLTLRSTYFKSFRPPLQSHPLWVNLGTRVYTNLSRNLDLGAATLFLLVSVLNLSKQQSLGKGIKYSSHC